jgi:hypothetical protein
MKNIINNIQNYFYSNDQELVETEEYGVVISVVKELHGFGVLQRASGNCFAISDIVSKLLKSKGIGNKIVECNLLVVNKSTNSIHFVGYEENNLPNTKITSHVICVTETKVPILIDLSVPYLSVEKPYIIERVNGKDRNIAEYNFSDTEWFYSEKLYSHLPLLHQQSILDRIQTDQNVDKRIENSEKQIKVIQRIVITILCVSSLNFVRGMFDHYQKYVVKDNGFGPNKTKIIYNKDFSQDNSNNLY